MSALALERGDRRSVSTLSVIARYPMADKTISDHTRKRLWTRAGNRCAFPGCSQRLLEPTADNRDDTIVGRECHIIAQKNSQSVARSVCLLTQPEQDQYAFLIKNRHGFDNLVLMCPTHSAVIDDVSQKYTVAAVRKIKQEHEEIVEKERNERIPPTNSSEAIAAEPSRAGGVRLLILDDVPAWERKAIRRLASSAPDAWNWLCSKVGDPANPDRIVALAEEWPEQLENGSFDLCHALLRLAESRARWTTAADIWERLADRSKGPLRADHLVCAAVDAKVGGEPERYTKLLNEAEVADRAAPRLRLVRLDEVEMDRSAHQQLQALEDLHTEDPALASVISVQKARAAMLVPDIDLAETYLEGARELDGESIPVRSMRINLCVQRARIALHEDRDFPLAETAKAKYDALGLRDELMSMGRWEESARLLMLAGDVPALLRDFASARKVIEMARPEELAAEDGPIVLGEAALRVAAPDLVLKLTTEATPTDAIRRLRAAATIDLLNLPDKESLETLREIALGGSRESENAAIGRLVACLPPIKAPWDEDVAKTVQGVGAQRFVPSLHIYHLAATGRVIEAQELADHLPNTLWAAELRLRVAGERGAFSPIKTAAKKFLALGPDASGRLLAAKAMAKAGDLQGAGELAAVIAHEVNASPLVRSEAFAVLVQTLADRDLWDSVRSEFVAWQKLIHHLPSPDQRLSAWEVRIANHPPEPI